MPNDHQQDLARSGYRLPDSFYVEPTEGAESVEEKSGDGGAKAAKSQKSEYGYKGKLKSQGEQAEELDARRTVDPETGQTIPDATEEQAQKAGATPTENKSSSKKGK